MRKYFAHHSSIWRLNLCLLLAFINVGHFLAQDDVVRLKIKNKYILADTNGNLLIDQAFNTMERTTNGENNYIVYNTDYKSGFIFKNKLVLPCIYDQVRELVDERYSEMYTAGLLIRDNMLYALANPDGKIVTPFENTSIRVFHLGEFARDKKDAQLFLFKKDEKLNLGYYMHNDPNNFKMILEEAVDGIELHFGTLILKKGDQQTILHIKDIDNAAKKMVFPFETSIFDIEFDQYSRVLPKQNKIEVYDLNDKLIKVFKNTTQLPEKMTLTQEGVTDEDIIVESVEEDISYMIARNDVARINRNMVSPYGIVIKGNGIESVQLRHKASVTDTSRNGKKGFYAVFDSTRTDFEPVLYFSNYDELVPNLYGPSLVILTRLKKYCGAIDVHGNTVLKPEYRRVKRIITLDAGQFLAAYTKKESYLLAYNAELQKTDTLYKGLKDDEYTVSSNAIQIKRKVAKNKFTYGYVYWRQLPSVEDRYTLQYTFEEIPPIYDTIYTDPLIPYFLRVSKDGKSGVYTYNLQKILPVEYEKVVLSFVKQNNVETPFHDRNKFRPYVLAEKEGQVTYVGLPAKMWQSSFLSSPIPGTLRDVAISDDGQFITASVGLGQFKLYFPNGKQMTEGRFSQIPRTVELLRNYWYIVVKDEAGKYVAIGRNGKVFKIPNND